MNYSQHHVLSWATELWLRRLSWGYKSGHLRNASWIWREVSSCWLLTSNHFNFIISKRSPKRTQAWRLTLHEYARGFGHSLSTPCNFKSGKAGSTGSVLGMCSLWVESNATNWGENLLMTQVLHGMHDSYWNSVMIEISDNMFAPDLTI